jgi:hypothetical protein
MVTSAPGTTARVESVTVPLMVPPVIWAAAGEEATTLTRNKPITSRQKADVFTGLL